jgi:hypothetical protein
MFAGSACSLLFDNSRHSFSGLHGARKLYRSTFARPPLEDGHGRGPGVGRVIVPLESHDRCGGDDRSAVSVVISTNPLTIALDGMLLPNTGDIRLLEEATH